MVGEAWIMIALMTALWLIAMGYGISTLAQPGAPLVGRHLRCPSFGREANVEFIIRAGEPPEVSRCSLLGDAMVVTCDKRCVETFGQAA